MFRCHLSVQIISVSSNTVSCPSRAGHITPLLTCAWHMCSLTSTSPAYRQCITCTSPVYHQHLTSIYVTSTSPVHHQDITSTTPVCPQYISRTPPLWTCLCPPAMAAGSPCHLGVFASRFLFCCCNEIILGSVRSCSDHVSGHISNYIANALVKSTSAHAWNLSAASAGQPANIGGRCYGSSRLQEFHMSVFWRLREQHLIFVCGLGCGPVVKRSAIESFTRHVPSGKSH